MELDRRLTGEEIDARHPDLIPALRAHPHIGWLLVRSAEHGAVVLGPRRRQLPRRGPGRGCRPARALLPHRGAPPAAHRRLRARRRHHGRQLLRPDARRGLRVRGAHLVPRRPGRPADPRLHPRSRRGCRSRRSRSWAPPPSTACSRAGAGCFRARRRADRASVPQVATGSRRRGDRWPRSPASAGGDGRRTPAAASSAPSSPSAVASTKSLASCVPPVRDDGVLERVAPHVVDEHGGQRGARRQRRAELAHDVGVGPQRPLRGPTPLALVQPELEQRRHHARRRRHRAGRWRRCRPTRRRA